jgi:predicted nucleotidyltransferase
MGRVFSEYQIKNNKVPNLSDFDDATKYFKSSVEEEIEAGTIDGAVIFGSVAIGAASIRSDFDCMIVPYEHSPESFGAIERIKGAVYDYAHEVPVNTILHHRTRLASGRHEIDRYFGAHLTGRHRIVIGNDPADYIRFGEASASEILLAYIAHKMRGVSQLSAAFTTEEHNKHLQRLLELPLAIGRKALMAIDEVEGTHNATEDSANKGLVTARSLALFEELGVSETAEKIMEYDGYYNEELEEVMITKRMYRYESFLEELVELAPEASRWLDALYMASQVRFASTKQD